MSDDVIACDLWFGSHPIKNPGYAYGYNGYLPPVTVTSDQGLREKFFQGVQRSMPGPRNSVQRNKSKKGLLSNLDPFFVQN